MSDGIKSEAFKGIFVLVAIGLALFIITKFGGTGSVVFDFELKAEDYNGMLLHVGIVAIIVERFVEVYSMIWRKPGRKEIEDIIKYEKDDAKKEVLERELTRYSAVTGVQAMYLAGFVGMMISLAGVHTLNVLFDASSLEGWQARLFYVSDVFVTAGLIAGGSSGINKASALIADTVKMMRGNVVSKMP